MRGYLVFIACISAIIVTASLSVDASFMRAFEESAVVSVGITTGERHFPEIDFERGEGGGEQAPADHVAKGLSGGNVPVVARSESEPEKGCVAESMDGFFSRGGVYSVDTSNGFSAEVIQSATRKISLSIGDTIDYGRFGSEDGLPPLSEPLDETELAFVFSEMIRAYMRSLSVGAELASISFSLEDERLQVDARVTVSFEELGKKYHFSGLPPTVVFRIGVSFLLENSELSVKSEESFIECESFPVSTSLLLFGCRRVFGMDDPRSAFASVVKNVFVNAGIYR